MGNNEAFSSFEASVLACCNHRVLSKPLLKDLMEIYRGMGIDSGGMEGTLSKVGRLDIVDIVISTWGLPLPANPKLPSDYKKWTPDQHKANDKWQDERWEAFRKITKTAGWE